MRARRRAGVADRGLSRLGEGLPEFEVFGLVIRRIGVGDVRRQDLRTLRLQAERGGLKVERCRHAVDRCGWHLRSRPGGA